MPDVPAVCAHMQSVDVVRDGSGRFTLSPLDEDSYVIRAFAEASPEVRIAGVHAGTDHLLVTLPRAGVVRGHAVDEQGQPMTPYSLSVIVAGTGQRQTQSISDADGRFQISNVEAGAHVKLIAVAEDGHTARAEAIVGDASADEVILVGTPGGTVKGRVIDGVDNRPIAQAMVSVAQYPPLMIFTDASGRFSLRGIPRSIPTECELGSELGRFTELFRQVADRLAQLTSTSFHSRVSRLMVTST